MQLNTVPFFITDNQGMTYRYIEEGEDVISKLSNNYPTAKPDEWLIFFNRAQKDIDPLFADSLR